MIGYFRWAQKWTQKKFWLLGVFYKRGRETIPIILNGFMTFSPICLNKSDKKGKSSLALLDVTGLFITCSNILEHLRTRRRLEVSKAIVCKLQKAISFLVETERLTKWEIISITKFTNSTSFMSFQ